MVKLDFAKGVNCFTQFTLVTWPDRTNVVPTDIWELQIDSSCSCHFSIHVHSCIHNIHIQYSYTLAIKFVQKVTCKCNICIMTTNNIILSI